MSEYSIEITQIGKAPEEAYKRENWPRYPNGMYVAMDTGYLFFVTRNSVESIYQPTVIDLFKLVVKDYEPKVDKSLLLEVVAAAHGKFLE